MAILILVIEILDLDLKPEGKCESKCIKIKLHFRLELIYELAYYHFPNESSNEIFVL